MKTEVKVIHFQFKDAVERAVYDKDYVALEKMTDTEVMAYNRICRASMHMITSEADHRRNLMHMHITNEIRKGRSI